MTLVASAPRFRGGRVWLGATASTMPTCCAPAGRLAPSAARSRRHRPWGRSPAQLPVGHVRQLDRVSRELLARAWAAGAGPDDAPFTIDLDSTICETSPLTNVVTRRLVRREVRTWCGPRHRTWEPVGGPIAPPVAWRRATPAGDIDVRSIRPRRPRTPGRSAAWNR